MNKFRLQTVALMGMMTLGLSAQAHVADETGWYATATLERSLSISDSGPKAHMGGVVNLSGETTYGASPAFALSVGKEFRRERQNEEPSYYRLEGELWSARLARESVKIGLLSANTSDDVSARALFLGGAMRLAKTENTRWWLGGAVGIAKVTVPDASALLGGSCNCTRAADGTGMAWRLKMLGERNISEHSAVYLELAHTRLPSISNSGLPSTTYGAWGVTSVGVGFRHRFH